MKTKILSRRYLIAASVVLLTVASAGYAFTKKRHHTMDPEAAAERLVSRVDRHLDLSDTQEKQVAAIVTTFFEKLQKERAAKQQQMSTLWTSDTLDVEAVTALLDSVDTLKQKRKSLMAESMVEFHGVLNPEQRRKVADNADRISWLFSGGQQRGHGRFHQDDDDHHRSKDREDDHYDDDDHHRSKSHEDNH